MSKCLKNNDCNKVKEKQARTSNKLCGIEITFQFESEKLEEIFHHDLIV